MHKLLSLCGALLLVLWQAGVVSADTGSLYIGDSGDDTVKQFDAATGASIRTIVSSNSGGLRTPAGLVIKSNQLVVSGQNAGSTDPGQILRYDLKTGTFAGALVSQV